MQRAINKIIIHCSDSEFGDSKDITQWHKEKGWSTIGYHFVILNGYRDKGVLTKEDNGLIEAGRDLSIAGAHCQGQNLHSIGICLIGVHNFTEEQFFSLKVLIEGLLRQFKINKSEIYGHRDFSSKTCPNFDVQEFVKKYLPGE